MSALEEIWHLENFEPGQVVRTMTRTLTEFDVMTFVGLGGFLEELWINPPRAAGGGHAPRLVPGYLTLILCEGLYVQTGRMHNARALVYLTDVKWTAPVNVGDAIYMEIEVESVRRSRKYPDRGIVVTTHRVKNQHATEVLTYRTCRMILART